MNNKNILAWRSADSKFTLKDLATATSVITALNINSVAQLEALIQKSGSSKDKKAATLYSVLRNNEYAIKKLNLIPLTSQNGDEDEVHANIIYDNYMNSGNSVVKKFHEEWRRQYQQKLEKSRQQNAPRRPFESAVIRPKTNSKQQGSREARNTSESKFRGKEK